MDFARSSMVQVMASRPHKHQANAWTSAQWWMGCKIWADRFMKAILIRDIQVWLHVGQYHNCWHSIEYAVWKQTCLSWGIISIFGHAWNQTHRCCGAPLFWDFLHWSCVRNPLKPIHVIWYTKEIKLWCTFYCSDKYFYVILWLFLQIEWWCALGHGECDRRQVDNPNIWLSKVGYL